MMPKQISRREMLRRSTLAWAGAYVMTSGRLAHGVSPNDRLNIACIGVGGRGADNVAGVAGENLIAFCDVDESRAGKTYEKHRHVPRYTDFRKMLDELEPKIDAVVVSTPDHTHAHPSLMAMRMGKHLYCEKPLAHNVYEVRQMTDLAREKKLATQLGAQRHAMPNMHRVVELVQSGAIGEVREVHAWIGGNRGMPSEPAEFPPAPPHLNWDLWIGPAAERRYSPTYAPYGWRFWWDFGTGETGNWGCHVLDIPYWALKLEHCTRVSASGPAVDDERTPRSMHVVYEFPAREQLPAVTLHWYHGDGEPAFLTKQGMKRPGTGVAFVGSEGILVTQFDKHWLYPEQKFKDRPYPDPFIPDSPGFYEEWFRAIRGGEPATVNFDYGGPMAETVLLGNVAYRSAAAFEWDAQNLRAVNCPEAQQYIREEYRPGWDL